MKGNKAIRSTKFIGDKANYTSVLSNAVQEIKRKTKLK
jgi:hypothetical protein